MNPERKASCVGYQQVCIELSMILHETLRGNYSGCRLLFDYYVGTRKIDSRRADVATASTKPERNFRLGFGDAGCFEYSGKERLRLEP